ncbi:LuxR C-terminal-related transcriptional regulator [Nocardioides sp. SYSU D00065]|uniref:helix-turn-helix transcriptional regulator n=1 Tax=Nocardioides sp. SYSU D00065 TaxID=2817378 RepID=UPI001B326C1C|nr:LuxR C-terminal-related transcriptional regulator [Nocardioides sp. SYSU D00065]
MRAKRSRATGPAPVVWVVSPHRLVAQAVVAALQSTGARVQFHAWENLRDELSSSKDEGRVRHLLVVIDGGGQAAAVEEIGRVLALGDVRVAVVTSLPSDPGWGALVADPAVDIVMMTTSLSQLHEVVDRLVAGDRLMEQERRQELRAAWIEALDKRQQLVQRVETLSGQQRRVLELLASGRRVPEVAQLLGITDGTVRSHVKSLRAKLGAKTQLEAVAILRQVQQVGTGAGVVPRQRAAPADAERAVERG